MDWGSKHSGRAIQKQCFADGGRKIHKIGDSILDFIPQGKTLYPVRNKNGIEYLGDRYTLEDISNKGELAIQSLFDSIFGDPEGIFTEDEIEEMAREEGLDMKVEKSGSDTKKETEKTADKEQGGRDECTADLSNSPS